MQANDPELRLDFRTDCAGIDWQAVADILKRAGMAHFEPDMHRKAFEASRVTVFVYQDGRLIAFGRSISDGIYQAGIYDVAVEPEFQSQGIGRKIIGQIMKQLPQCNFILYAAPGKEGFYRKLGFRKMQTGMALFKNADMMSGKGFTE